MLRHYDALGLLRPAQVDPATGYRYYHAGQFARLNRIIALKELGFTLGQVARCSASRSATSGCAGCSSCAGPRCGRGSRPRRTGCARSRRGSG
jgi:DNA-binding transcriptional MerR regulator